MKESETQESNLHCTGDKPGVVPAQAKRCHSLALTWPTIAEALRRQAARVLVSCGHYTGYPRSRKTDRTKARYERCLYHEFVGCHWHTGSWIVSLWNDAPATPLNLLTHRSGLASIARRNVWSLPMLPSLCIGASIP